MATIKVMLRTAHLSKEGTHPIVIRITAGLKQRLIPVGYKVRKNEWKGKEVSSRHPDYVIINSAIATKEAEIKKYLAECSMAGKPIRLDLIGTKNTSYSFSQYLLHRAAQYKSKGKIVMWRKLDRFKRELQECFGAEVFFDDIDQDKLRTYENWLIQKNNVENTRAKKFKFLRQFFQGAMDEGKVIGVNPFKLYKIASKPVNKEKLTAEEIKKIEELQITPGAVNDARNLFLFSYYTKDARFENCIMIKHSDIKDGRIYFRTNKGNKFISVKIHERLQVIIEQYPGSGFIFPFVEEAPESPDQHLKLVDSRNVIINRNLKVVAGLAKIDKHLTFHIARHTFAFLLKQKTQSIHVIQDSLGHSDARTTQMYLKSLDDEVLDIEMEKLYGA